MAVIRLDSNSGNKQELNNGQMECVRSHFPPQSVAVTGAARRSSARLPLVYVVYNMEDEVDVDIEGDEFQSNVRSEYLLNVRI